MSSTKPTKQLTPITFPDEGYITRETPRGIKAIRIEYWADKTKRNKEYVESVRKVFPREADFRREVLIDWTSSAGDAYYPEYVLNGGDKVYMWEPPGLINGPIYRSWDFGGRHPACLWFQVDFKAKVAVMLRELMPNWGAHALSGMTYDTRSFRDVVMFLSGQLGMEYLKPTAQRLLKLIYEEPRYPEPPWFNSGAIPLRYLDVSGPEANTPADELPEEDLARTRALILAEAGIQLSVISARYRAREDVVRERLKIKDDNWPGMTLSPYCFILREGMGGGIAYESPTLKNPLPTGARRDGYYEHLHDCLGQGLVQVFPAVEEAKLPLYQPQQIVNGLPGSQPIPQGVESLSLLDLGQLADRWK